MITNSKPWEKKFYEEIHQAEQAREAGNEGRARVCARRAAGIVVGEYLSTIEQNFFDLGAYDNLKFFILNAQVSPETITTAEYFILKVDTDHNLPVDVDLVEEAIKLKMRLCDIGLK